MNDTIQKLRNGEQLKLFDKENKTFITFQLNKKEKSICWERWVSKDRKNWINHNKYLSLKEVILICNNLKRRLPNENNQERPKEIL